MAIHFFVAPTVGPIAAARNRAYLVSDRWDDWFQFETLFTLIVFDAAGERHDIGGVKIGQFGLTAEQRRPAIPHRFEQLDDRFFSLGQDDSYYEALKQLGPNLRDLVLQCLHDVASDEELFERALIEPVMRTSLLRSVSPVTVRGQFRRLARGDARLTPYNFSYTPPKTKGSNTPPAAFHFDVIPESQPPTNIHVVIGRNGVGKTHLLRHMTRALLAPDAPARVVGNYSSDNTTSVSDLFANLVSVTFSAFDPFEPAAGTGRGDGPGIRYSYIGLQRAKTKEGKIRSPKSSYTLAKEFVQSALECRNGAERKRWRQALEALEADPLFREAAVTNLADREDTEDWTKRAHALFRKLSSGHKIVLLTTTRLVETVDERTLVLLDEPEAHLHPPLLSAFIRALSDLLVQRNGVAIIATHSPVVLQEVPRTCVWKLRRTGAESVAERPDIETFGENLGVLTREAFGFEVTDAGFHTMLKAVVDAEPTYDSVVQTFGEQLGAEARAMVRALVIANGDDSNES